MSTPYVQVLFSKIGFRCWPLYCSLPWWHIHFNSQNRGSGPQLAKPSMLINLNPEFFKFFHILISVFLCWFIFLIILLIGFKGEKYVERLNFFVVFQSFKLVFIEDSNAMDIKIAKWEKMRTLKCVVSGFLKLCWTFRRLFIRSGNVVSVWGP